MKWGRMRRVPILFCNWKSRYHTNFAQVIELGDLTDMLAARRRAHCSKSSNKTRPNIDVKPRQMDVENIADEAFMLKRFPLVNNYYPKYAFLPYFYHYSQGSTLRCVYTKYNTIFCTKNGVDCERVS